MSFWKRSRMVATGKREAIWTAAPWVLPFPDRPDHASSFPIERTQKNR
jgi:hypothetical protein